MWRQLRAPAGVAVRNVSVLRLEARFSGGAVFTEILDASNDGDRQIARDLQLIKMQNELSRHDQEWSLERDTYRCYSRHGSSLPTESYTVMTVFGGIIAVAFGIFWTVAAAGRAPGFFPMFGVLFIGFALVMTFYACIKHAEYKVAVEHYEGRRQQLLHNIRNLNAGQPSSTRLALESVSP